MSPLGLWGVQFGDINIGIGPPTFAFGEGSFDYFVKTLAATADGFIPFFDPFQNVYSSKGKCGQSDIDKGLEWSKRLGGISRDFFIGAIGPGIFTSIKNATIATKQVTVIGHYPEYIQVAEKMGANYFKPIADWTWKVQGEFIKNVIQRGDDVFIGTYVREGASVLKKEILQLIKAGYTPMSKGSRWLIKM